MKYTLLNIGWNAEPNAPMPELSVYRDSVTITFGLNYFLYPEFKEDDKGKLTFHHCYKYDFNGSNDEGYYLGQHRYNYKQLPWGGFYELETYWKTDFPENPVILSDLVNSESLRHYLFFFRDECFECVAEGFELQFFPASE